MATGLSLQVINKILKDVGSDYGESFQVEIGKETWFTKHCGRKMVKVKVWVFLAGTCRKHGGQSKDLLTVELACSCPNCHFHEVDTRFSIPFGRLL